jgi:hypothetical protein
VARIVRRIVIAAAVLAALLVVAISNDVPKFVGSGHEGVAIRDVLPTSSGTAFDDGDFLAMGVRGRVVYLHPIQRIVIVKTSTDPDDAGRERETVAAFRVIAGALAGQGP